MASPVPNGAAPGVVDGPVGAPVSHHGAVVGWASRRLRRDLANWRLFVVRLVTSGLAVVLTVGLLPGLRFTSWRWGEFLLIGVVFGVLNALVKPVIQFFALRYLVASYGLVVILINALMLALLSLILGGEIHDRGPVALFFGGLLVGLIGLALDTLAGTTPPFLDRAPGDAATDWDPGPPVVAPPLPPVPVAPSEDSAVLAQAAAVLAGSEPASPVGPVAPSPAEVDPIVVEGR